MMKITLFVFAVLLVAVVFAVPKPEGEEKPISDTLDPLNLINEVEKGFKTVFSKENMDKLKETINVEQLQKTFETVQEKLQGMMKEVTQNKPTTE